MGNETQREVLEWLCRVEEEAVRGQVKTRLLDEIGDCKRALSRELTAKEWQAKKAELSELMEQLGRQLPGDAGAGERAEDIAQKASEMLGQCRRSGEELGREYCSGSATYVQEAERAVEELSNVTANFDDVTDSGRFLGRARNIGERYRQQIDSLEEQYVHSVNQNYQNMMNRMKNLCAAAGGGKDTERKFYHAYYAKQDVLEQNMAAYACGMEKGESSIFQYAREVQNPLQQLIKRLRQKAAVTKWIPVILILALMILNGVYHMVSGSAEHTGAQENAGSQELNVVVEKVLEWAGDSLLDKVGEVVDGIIKNVLIAFLLPLLILVIFLYFLWMKGVDRRCRKNIAREAGRLLGTSYEEWARQGKLMAAVGESLRQTMEYIDIQYSGILAELVNDGQAADAGGTSFADLRAEWENIKRKAELSWE